MAVSLILSQCLRALKSEDKKTVQNLEIWLGDLLGTLSSTFSVGTRVDDIPIYFEHIGLLLADLMSSDFLNSENF